MAHRGAARSGENDGARPDGTPSRETVAAVEQASEDDRRWFKRHRDRACRLRPALDGEFPGATFPPGAAQLAVVKQISVGARMRLAMWATKPLCDCEECLAGMWGHLAPPRFRKLSLDIAAMVLRVGR